MVNKSIDVTLANGHFLCDFVEVKTDCELKRMVKFYIDKAEEMYNSVAVKIDVEDIQTL